MSEELKKHWCCQQCHDLQKRVAALETTLAHLQTSMKQNNLVVRVTTLEGKVK